MLLILFNRSLSFLSYITENGVGFSGFFYMLVLIIPWMLTFILPLAFLVATLLLYHQMSINNEITIFKNSGLTKFAIAKPTFWLAGIITIACFLISFYLTPYANRKLRVARLNFKENYANLAFRDNAFESIKNITLYIKEKGDNNTLHGILIEDKRNKDHYLTITAKSGKLMMEDGSILLNMQVGTIQRFNRDKKKLEMLNFDSYVLNLSDSQDEESKKTWALKEKYVHELFDPNETAAQKLNSTAEFYRRITYPLLTVLFSLIAVGAMLRGEFRRAGQNINLVIAIVVSALAFFCLNIGANLIEHSMLYVFAPYLTIVIFAGIGIYLLVSN